MEELSSVVYVAHLPDDFEEKQIRDFFSQFGKVKKVQVSRNAQTGNSRHYGWIKFQTPEIAQIVAQSVLNYPLGGSLLKAEVVPKSKLHEKLFTNARRGARPKKQAEPLTKLESAFIFARKEEKLAAKLQAMGIQYEWPSMSAQFKKANVPIPEKPAKETEKKTK